MLVAADFGMSGKVFVWYLHQHILSMWQGAGGEQKLAVVWKQLDKQPQCSPGQQHQQPIGNSAP